MNKSFRIPWHNSESGPGCTYVSGKICVKQSLSKMPKIVFKTNHPRGTFCNTFDLNLATDCY